MLVCYTGGGTLGHVYPALAVHEVLLDDPQYRAMWIGRENPAEREAVTDAGIPFYPIQSGKLRRYRSVENITDLFRIGIAFFQALSLLRKHKPEVLFSKGGFVSVPPVFAAKALGMRVLTHESDALPGLATRLNSKVADTVCLPFAGSEGDLPRRKVVITGNPLRKALFEERDLSSYAIEEGIPLLLILGGSQGSQQINTLVRQNLTQLCRHAFVIHQCGQIDYQETRHARYVPVRQIGPELGTLYRKSSLVVSRGGAGTLEEILTFGCASLIIPLSTAASRGDQVVNAERLVAKEAARALFGEVTEERFLTEVVELLENPLKRSILSTNAQNLAVGGSAEIIASLIRKGV